MKGREILIYLSLKYEGDWEKIYQAVRSREKFDFNIAEELIKEVKCGVITCVDQDYPEALKACYHPPFVLYYYGDRELITKPKKRMAMIGSRDASIYGLENAEYFGRALAHDFIIVSGLAKGIDTASLAGAISNNGEVIAILGSGIDYCYPRENSKIYQDIKKNHLLISEYPLKTKPHDYHFPLRNRLIAVLSDGIFVLEGKQRSGTLITVGHALTLGKDIFCLPHRRGESPTTNALIRDGANLVTEVEDIYNYYGMYFDEKVEEELK